MSAQGAGAPAVALEVMTEDDMEVVSGTGIAFTLENFRFAARPTSYFEIVGSNPLPDQTWQRGDYRFFGLSISSAGSPGIDWAEVNGTDNASGGCAAGTDGMGCPMGSGGVTNFASVGNPIVLRVFPASGYDYQANLVSPTVLELIGPTQMDVFRWAFWGELDVLGKSGGASLVGSSTGLLKSQSLILGAATSVDHMGVRRGAAL